MHDDPAMPRQSLWMFNWFRWYCTRYARKHFHAVRLSKSSPAIPSGQGEPLIFVMNHPSWWDIIIGFLLCNRFTHYRHFAPIDAEMLLKYRFFQRLGFFGIDHSPRGAAVFLRTCRTIFAEDFRSLWITAQGRFVDPRERPIALRPGIGYIASRLERGYIIPVAVEYPFWEEPTAEALIRFGNPLQIGFESIDGRVWTERIEIALTEAQDILAGEAIRRDPSLFEILVGGRTGIGGVYDWWRRTKAWLTGKRFNPSHSDETVGEPSA